MRSEPLGQRRGPRALCSFFGLALLAFVAEPGAGAGEPYFRARASRGAVVVPTAGPYSTVLPGAVNNYGRLGTFYPTPFMQVRGNAPAGGGYSPLGSFGDSTLSLYGPLSSLRMTTAPVLTYSSGYDGRGALAPGTSFSAPNLPGLTPVVNPTQASYYYGFRQSGSPPWWANGINWIDQN